MTTLVIDRQTLPEPVSSLLSTARIAVRQSLSGGTITLTPIVDPADYDNETDYLNAIPGMPEKLIEGLNTPSSECIPLERLWDDV